MEVVIEPPRFGALKSMPAAGPNADPLLVEIDVTPWSRISVEFRSAQVTKSYESGSVWYWRPETSTPVTA